MYFCSDFKWFAIDTMVQEKRLNENNGNQFIDLIKWEKNSFIRKR